MIFIGAGSLTAATARLFIARGHQVVIVERDKERIETLAEQFDCGLVHGDGSTPAILRELGPDEADTLFCLTADDQTNIIASLVGRSLGFARVITRVENREFEHICSELGLDDTILPTGTIARYLADTAEGLDILEVTAMLKHEARMLALVVHTDKAVSLAEAGLPANCRVVCIYRHETMHLPGDDQTRLKDGDEVILITRREDATKLRAWWQSHFGAAETS
jgi:trk system potassium uptake protein TrkA